MPELADLARLGATRNVCVSPENPTGEPGQGARAVPGPDHPAYALGVGWKVRPSVPLPAGETVVLADLTGPGTVTRLWLTAAPTAWRDCVLRVWWDDEVEPSVAVPLGDFFCLGFGEQPFREGEAPYVVSSLPMTVLPTGGVTCYLPMPFRQRARIAVSNEGPRDVPALYWTLDAAMGPVPDDAAYLHAAWRRTTTSREDPCHVVLDGVQGRGHYVGTFLAWTQLSEGWWGEGAVAFHVDGDPTPTLCGTGTEDYVGGAWSFGQTVSTPWQGYPWASNTGVPKHALYRWHVPDPVRFTTDLRVTVQTLGWWPDGTFQPLADDVASVAYWYQPEPHASQPALPDVRGRWPR